MIRVAIVAALLAVVLVEGQLTGTVDNVPGNGTEPRPPRRRCPRGPMERLACKVVDDATGDVLKEHPCRNGTECNLGPLEIDTPENDSISIYFCNDEFNQQLAQRLACRIEVGEEIKKEEQCLGERPCSIGPLSITYEGAAADAYFCELPPKRGHRQRGHGRRGFGRPPMGGRFGPRGGDGMEGSGMPPMGGRFGPRGGEGSGQDGQGDAAPAGAAQGSGTQTQQRPPMFQARQPAPQPGRGGRRPRGRRSVE